MNLSDDYLQKGYTSHNAMGEHALKHHGDVVTASRLREQYLDVDANIEPRQEFIDRITERQAGWDRDNQGDFVFVCPVKDDGQWLEACAYGITKFDVLGTFAMRATVEELVVAEQHRGKGIATWILQKLANQRFASIYASPTELVIDRSTGPDGKSFADRITREVGRVDVNGNPVIWLPGHEVRAPANDYDKLVEKMPEDYTGVLELFARTDEERPFQEVYRDGALFARIDSLDEFDGDGHRLKTVNYSNGTNAIETGYDAALFIRVLNRPEVVTEAVDI